MIGPTVTFMSVLMVKIVLCDCHVYKAVLELVSHCYPMRAGKPMTAITIYCQWGYDVFSSGTWGLTQHRLHPSLALGS